MNHMKGVPIPLRKQDLEMFKGGEGIKMNHIAENIAWIMGIDPKFEHMDSYLEFIRRLFNSKLGQRNGQGWQRCGGKQGLR